MTEMTIEVETDEGRILRLRVRKLSIIQEAKQ